MINDSLTYDQIYELEDIINPVDDFNNQIKLVWSAMTDWPTIMNNTDDLLTILIDQIKSGLTKRDLVNHNKKLSANFGIKGNAWKAESVTSLIELFDYPDSENLEEVIHMFCIKAKIKLSVRP